jgi:hypothetical protein
MAVRRLEATVKFREMASHHVRKRPGAFIKGTADLTQRQTKTSQLDYLVQTFYICVPIDTVAAFAAERLEQAKLLVVMKCADRDPAGSG